MNGKYSHRNTRHILIHELNFKPLPELPELEMVSKCSNYLQYNWRAAALQQEAQLGYIIITFTVL